MILSEKQPSSSRQSNHRWNKVIACMKNVAELSKAFDLALDPLPTMERIISHVVKIFDDLLTRGLIDPANVYAMKLLEFSSRSDLFVNTHNLYLLMPMQTARPQTY
jgi:hypothetical protein